MPTATQTIKKLEIAADKWMNGMYIESITSYTWVQALRDAGYSNSYALARCADLWDKAQPMIEKLQTTLKIKQQWDLNWVDEQYKDLFNECRNKSDRTNAKGCLDSMSRRLSGFTDNLNSNKEEPTQLSEQELDILTKAASQAKDELAKPRLKTG